MHKTEEQVMFGDLFLNIWLQRAYEEQDNANTTQNMQQLGQGHRVAACLTRRSSLPSGPGGGFNRAARSPQGQG